MNLKEQDISPLSHYFFDVFFPGIKRVFIPFILAGAISLLSFVGRMWFVPEIPLWLQVSMFFIQSVFILTLWFILRGINRFFDSIWSYSKLPLLRFILQLALSFAFYSAIRSILFYFILDYLPIQDKNTFKTSAFIIDFVVAVAINVGFLAYYFLNQWRNSWMMAQRLEKENAIVQYDNLKNQMNPHFLFNSLTSLQSLIYKDQDLATRFLQQLSKVYRYLLENRMKDTVSLKREIEFVQHYIELLQARFGNTLRVAISIPPEHYDMQIVPVTLQIMIENAIKHNSLSVESPLVITISSDHTHLIVSNSIQLKEYVESSNKLGLDNFKKLYSFLIEVPVEWGIQGDVFQVKIPLLT